MNHIPNAAEAEPLGPVRNKNTAFVLSAMVFLVALNLRPALTAVGPIIDQIGAELSLGEGALGVLGSLPLLAFFVFSPFVHRLSKRIGTDGSIIIALLLMASGIVIRSYTGDIGLWLGTVIIGAAIAIGNVLVPVLVKKDFPAHISRATSVYSACISGSAAIASVLAVPIASASSWRDALAFWAIPAVLVALIWIPKTRFSKPLVSARASKHEPSTNVWKQPLAWMLTIFMGLQAGNFYIIVNWFPSIEMDRGIPAELTGVHMFVYLIAAIIGGLLLPQLVNRGKDQVIATIAASAPMPIAVVGFLAIPDFTVFWLILAGLSSGASLAIALALVSFRGRTELETTKLSGMVQSLGYLLAAAGPAIAGMLTEASQSWTLALLFLLGLSLIQIVIGFWCGRAPRAETLPQLP
ncbi:MAG: MFS transporter [Microbacteriaceae bacterium]